jgi:hypothetical protein
LIVWLPWKKADPWPKIANDFAMALTGKHNSKLIKCQKIFNKVKTEVPCSVAMVQLW